MSTSSDDLQVLRALYQTENARLRHRDLKIRGGHECMNAENRVIFGTCAALTRFGARTNPPSLVAQVTRAGLADVDLDPLFEPLSGVVAKLVGRFDALERRER